MPKGVPAEHSPPVLCLRGVLSGVCSPAARAPVSCGQGAAGVGGQGEAARREDNPDRVADCRLPHLRQMAEDAYQGGKSTILELLGAMRSRTELQLSHLDLVAGVMQAEIDTLAAAGLIDTDRARP